MQYIVDGYEFSDDDLASAAYEAAGSVLDSHKSELLTFLADRWQDEYRKAIQLDFKEGGNGNPSLSQMADSVSREDGQKFIDDILEFVGSV